MINTKRTVIGMLMATSMVTTQANAQVPWAISQILNGLFASAIFSAATASTIQNPVFQVPLSHSVFWLGDTTTIALKRTSGVDSVRYTFSRLPINDDGTGAFEPAGEITVATTTPVSLGQYVSSPGKYRVVATMLNAGAEVGTAKQIDFLGMTRPVIALENAAPTVTSVEATSPVTATASVQADMEPTKVTMMIGNNGTAYLAQKDPATGLYTANMGPRGGQAGPYPIITTVYFDKASVTNTSAANTVTVVSPPKLSLVSAPKLIDSTYGTKNWEIKVKLKNTSPESTLSTIDNVGGQNFVVDWFVGASKRATLGPADPFLFTFNGADYAALIASGVKQLTVYALVYHKDYPGLTKTVLPINIALSAPWAMPEWQLTKTEASPLVAPASSRLSLQPLATYDKNAAKRHKLAWTWSLPSDPGITIKASGSTLTYKVSKPGAYPVAVSVSDDLGSTKTYSTTIEAIASTLNVSSLSLVASPVSTRVPVVVTPKVASTSTHPLERVAKYEITVDGATVYSGSSLRAFSITQPGPHDVAVNLTSNYGSTASKTVSFVAAENQLPVCGAFKTSFAKAKDGTATGVTIASTCVDHDGRLTGYAWQINGTGVMGTNPSRAYSFGTCESEVSVTVQAKDDSGGITEHTETIQRGPLPASCTP